VSKSSPSDAARMNDGLYQCKETRRKIWGAFSKSIEFKIMIPLNFFGCLLLSLNENQRSHSLSKQLIISGQCKEIQERV
jgi:hypothetical protein